MTMTEAEWLAGDQPVPMLHHLGEGASPRKRRLLAAAFCRAVWKWLDRAASRAAIEVAERRADGKATKREMTEARKAARAAVKGHKPLSCREAAASACLNAVEETDGVAECTFSYMYAAIAFNRLTWRRVHADAATQAARVREVLGNPFRPVAFLAEWRTPAALTLAEAAYDERSLPSGHLDPARLVVLSDAVEEAGCADADFLAHLRSPGPHVRGCWALDLVLGRE